MQSDFALRRSFRAYLGEIIIFGGLSLLLILAWMRTSNSSWLAAIVIMLAIVLVSHYADFRYRVFWRDGAIARVTSNGVLTTIRAADISRVVTEKSDVRTTLTLSRPMRRITVYAADGRHLDVSLKHFVISDVHRLLQEIHKQRSDLKLPTV